MLVKKLLLLIAFLFLITHLSLAATFTVTSNADAGPGTLREALANAAANGILTQDVITFNLPGALVSDRIIRLKTQLPNVSSNLIIDGTTQPGIVFGVSDARVVIEPETSPANFNALNIYGDVNNNGTAAKNIEIYGLYIRNFAKITNVATPDNSQGSGIVLTGDASFITIGAPGKGNVICGNINGIVNSNYTYYTGADQIVIQSNIIGLLDDGFTANTNMYGINLSIDKNALIGGINANMGNVIAANVTNVSVTRGYNFAANNFILIQNNKIGTNFSGNADFKNIPLFQLSAFIQTFGIFINGSGIIAKITDNIVSGQRYCGIYIDNATFEIEGNNIGTDKAGTANLGNGEGIRVGVNAAGNIGGAAATAKNIIAYNNYGIEALNNAHALITRNSMFCNKDYGISVATNYYQPPFVKVLSFGATKVSGVATPNSKIELFFADACGFVNCQGKTYITTVNADGSGTWTYTGTISSPVIATATDGNNNTSPFSSLVIQDNDIVIKQLTCAYTGSITITPDFSGLEFHWDKKEQNGTLTSLANTKNISGLQPGTYQLTVQYPGGCQKSTKLFEIKDQRVKIQNIRPPMPECRQKFFPVDVNFQGGTGNVRFEWKNAAGEVKSTDKNGVVPAGTYTLTISDDAGCAVTSAAFTITAKPGPDYDLSTMNVATARCGIAEGSIKDITTYVGIGTLSYQWYDSNNNPLPGKTNKDLTNVKGGSYRLELRDQSQCSPYSTPYIGIQETNSVNITTGTITRPTCGLNNGAINNVYVDNADFFQWTGPNGPIPTTASNYHNLPSNLAEGQYTLYAKNTATGCDNSRLFNVERQLPETFSYNPNITAASCDLSNGSIKLQFNGNVIPQSYQWIDPNNIPRGNTNQITDLAPGLYSAVVTDKYGCPSTLGPFEVKKTPLLVFATANNPIGTADQCNQKLGHIDGVLVTGGVPPYNYKWTDKNTGQPVGGNTADLTNIGKGDYSLVVTDATPCAIPLTWDVTVDNIQFIPTAPILADRKICVPEKLTLKVLNTISGNYNLYTSETAQDPIQKSATGQFNVQVNESSDYYVSYNIGTCESPRSKAHVEVILVDVKFPNVFSPNEDGINDYWKIEGLQKFPGTVVQVFTRGGQKVFESKDYATPFVGKQNGKLLAAGVYYYIINLNTGCELLSGSLTILR
ncbi:gliding motility-associated C-terminal domain-containing protein [Mucilaginibacter sp. RB4R14]|uniref:T9SS type B sorting domain-containing protein n=1 Tax=Mucilaginibacter aurantiaciroseus TaxID=2949308 RepID=UPI002090B0BE|nr:gliding motility-associated C-terminal domain-containing protein [Mucilaginibacter aurantiaciroseus]MCO5937098.1 gliding motility-associated C-terminal domain-containing protein [Mucilaginibacter aurantiaciroseus]